MQAPDPADTDCDRMLARQPPRPRVSPATLAPAVAAVSIVLMCFAGPLTGLLPGPVGGSPLEAGLPMLSTGHPLGTDLDGNDVLSRLVYGGRTSLEIAFAVNAIGLLLGATVGAFGAQRGGYTDALISRVLDAVIAFPSLALALAITYILGPGERNTILALTLFSVPAFARVSRAASLRLLTQPFMLIARLSGTSCARVLLRHIAPNILPQLLTFGLLGIGLSIVLEGALSFAGAGVPPPAPSWGNMIFHGQQSISLQPSLALLPCGCLVGTVVAFNSLGETLRMKWARR